MQRYRDLSPFIAGSFPFGQPSYIIMHGTRSTIDRSIRAEFDSNRRYAVTNTKGFAWHVTVGEDAFSNHLDIRNWGWHANEESRQSLGVEFAQPTADHTINEAQVRAFVAWFRTDVLGAYPFFNLAKPGGMRMHSEVASGKLQGKTDVYPIGDPRWPVLRDQIIEALGGLGQPGTGGGPHDHLIDEEADPGPLFDVYQERLDVAVRDALGPAQYRGLLRNRDHWGGPAIHILRLQRGLLGVIGGEVVNLTGHALDDWQVDHGSIIQRF